ncbi:hypothetical protein [Pseudomonas sp. R5(2019)]|uniref:hypothetical protein n=1 Tax=Pseudomonas sp. R5(2019) TaxID=2697566 RepID=UPI001412CB0F|nr:hypothetical protein [Pseudomonas sp. R5(2019)]NBA98626.1 hypothetical protein [Pseudomonas sp. R5(2019)]
MDLTHDDFRAIRSAIAALPGDLSNDAVGAHVAKIEDVFAPEKHAVALDPEIPIVVGSRGSGKSFWSSILGQSATLKEAAIAYPKLGLADLLVHFGYTGVGGLGGISQEAIDQYVPDEATLKQAKDFWWATILSAAAQSAGEARSRPGTFIKAGLDWEEREDLLIGHQQRLEGEGKTLLIVYDALDTVARTWPRRRLLTEALLEVVWAMRAFRSIRVKLFLRPDQIEDDGLRFVELPKLRTGAVRLSWSWTDLYGLLYSRLASSTLSDAKKAFENLLQAQGLAKPDRKSILTRRWSPVHNEGDQKRLMTELAGQFRGTGSYAFKKGGTYEWPLRHTSDAHAEVTPRSFLGLMNAAAKFGAVPLDKALMPDGIRHGLREASKTRVDQLQLEFPWIKKVLAPLAGLLLPQDEKIVYDVWKKAGTVKALIADAEQRQYLLPFKSKAQQKEDEIFSMLQEIGVMFRRNDGRLDMPDLFRVAAKLLKKGALAPAGQR